MSITEQIQGQNDPSMLEVLNDIGDIAKQGLRNEIKHWAKEYHVHDFNEWKLDSLVEIAWSNVPHVVQEDDPHLSPDPHADLKAQWELDAHCVGEEEAVKFWETRSPAAWFTCTSQPLRDNADYRRKPTAPDFSEEIGLREVQKCPNWPEGYKKGKFAGGTYIDTPERYTIIGTTGWSLGVPNERHHRQTILAHLKQYRPGGERYAQEKVHEALEEAIKEEEEDEVELARLRTLVGQLEGRLRIEQSKCEVLHRANRDKDHIIKVRQATIKNLKGCLARRSHEET